MKNVKKSNRKKEIWKLEAEGLDGDRYPIGGKYDSELLAMAYGRTILAEMQKSQPTDPDFPHPIYLINPDGTKRFLFSK